MTEFPDIEQSDQSQIDIFAPLYSSGQRRKEIDIVVIALWKSNVPRIVTTDDLYLSTRAREEVSRDLHYPAGSTVAFRSLCCTIEVKATPRVDFQDTHIWITYPDGSQTEAVRQSHEQRDALVNYLRTIKSPIIPMVTNLIWLRDIDEAVPARYRNVLGPGASLNDFLSAVVRQSPDRLWTPPRGDTIFNSCFAKPDEILKVADVLIQHSQITATPLDRKRLNRLTEGRIETKWRTHVGSEEVVLTGRGGSGKTFALLKTALELYEKGSKVLILTYNHALVSDIQRQLFLLGVSSEAMGPSVRVLNIHRFMLDLSELWGFALPQTFRDFDEAYESLLIELNEYLTVGAITRQDIIKKLFTELALDYRWDFVFVDEGQDWSDRERDILFHIYRRSNMLVSVGHDQLIRSEDSCDWCVGDDSEWHRQALTKCLRMCVNLASFTTRIAELLDVATWKIKEQAEMPGGSVEVIVGDFFSDPTLNRRLLDENESGGDLAIDMLYCLPSSLLVGKREERASLAIQLIGNEWGTPVWDGTSDDERRTIPWREDQIRIVQYESSRGLEGSSVVCLAVDRWFDQRVKMWKQPRKLGSQVSMSLTDDERAIRSAKNWLMIPLTRPISRLILHLEDSTSFVGQLLQRVHKESGGMRWTVLPSTENSPQRQTA